MHFFFSEMRPKSDAVSKYLVLLTIHIQHVCAIKKILFLFLFVVGGGGIQRFTSHNSALHRLSSIYVLGTIEGTE